MRCEEARAALLAGETDPRVEEHLSTCPSCRAEMGRIEEMRAALGDALTWLEPATGLEDQVMTLLTPARARDDGRRLGVVAAAVVAVILGGVVVWTATRPPPPDWEVTLPGVGHPGEVTVAGWNRDGATALRVSADGITPAPGGHVYELWLSRDGAYVSAGSFVTVDQPVLLSVGVSRRDYPRVWITLEPLDGDPAPSKQVLFDAYP